MPTDPIVLVEDLEKRYGSGRKAVDAVRGISFGVGEGEIFGLLGPNGAGKSTTIHVLITLLQPTKGRASVAGYDVVKRPMNVRRECGAALQDTGLDDLQTGRELLNLHGRLYGLSPQGAAVRTEEVLELLGLTEAADRRLKTYSGGMRRRLDLSLALIHHPRVLVVDEPTTGLDPASRLRVWEEVKKLRAGGMTVLLTTQYLEEADQLADRVAIIDEGLIVACDTPARLKRSFGGETLTLSFRTKKAASEAAALLKAETEDHQVRVEIAKGAKDLPAIVRRLTTKGLAPLELNLQQPTLDDVFLKVTGHHLEGAEQEGDEKP